MPKRGRPVAGLELTPRQRAALRVARIDARLTVERVAATLGVSASAVRDWEGGRRRVPSADVLAAWRRVVVPTPAAPRPVFEDPSDE